MKISIDRRAKMIPIMEISSGDEVNIGGFDYVVETYFRVGKDLMMRMELGWSCLLTNMANL